MASLRMQVKLPVAIVTGSNRGIGEAIARALRRDGTHIVVTNGRSSLKGPGDRHVRADVSTPGGARRLIGAVKKTYGRVDLLVCNVGEYFATPVSGMDVDRWQKIFASNLWSAVLCVREALPLLRRRGGSIVTIGTPMAHVARANPRIVAFQMAKTALAVLTKSLARAEAPHGVRANMVSPGYIRTATPQVPRRTPQIPAGRLGRPEEVADLVAWLASPEAGYVTGAVIDVGGGVGV